MLTGYFLSFIILLALYSGFLLVIPATKCPFFQLLPLVLFLAAYIIAIPIRVFLIRSVARKATSQSAQEYKPLILNQSEEEIPLRLCRLPGVAAGIVISDLGYLCLSWLRLTILKRTGYPSIFPETIGASLLINTVTGLLVTPLAVVVVRLALQEYGSAEASTDSACGNIPDIVLPNFEAVDPPPRYEETEGIENGLAEDVITLREGLEPYKGLVDCARSIVREEGLGTLWRGWGILTGLFFVKDMLMAMVDVPKILGRM
jgi:hypothetical protein